MKKKGPAGIEMAQMSPIGQNSQHSIHPPATIRKLARGGYSGVGARNARVGRSLFFASNLASVRRRNCSRARFN